MSRARDLWLRLFGHGGRLQNGPDGHPTPELLTAYHEDRLPPERDDEIQEHLVECEECPELVLEFDRYSSKEMPVMPPEDLSDTRVERAWYQLRRKLTADIVVSRPRWLARPPLAWCVVGMLLLCTTALAFRVRTLTSLVQLLEAPELNATFTTVSPPPVTRGPIPEPQEVWIPQGVQRVALVFEPPDRKVAHADYRLEIQSREGRSVWASAGLRKRDEGTFSVGFSRRMLPEGEYRFRVLGIDRGHELLVQEYPVRLSYL